MALSKKNETYLVLDLGSYSIKVVLGTYDGTSIKVKKAFTVDTPDGTYYDGKVNDIESIATEIKNAIAEHGIKEKKCIVTFNSKDVIHKELSVPELSYEDTIGLIRYEISQYLPIDVEEYDIAYKVVEKSMDLDEEDSLSEEYEGENNLTVFSYIVKKTLIDSFHELVLACSLQPVFLDFHSNSISKFVKHINKQEFNLELIDEEEKSSVAYVDLGHKNILIDIADGDSIVLSRIVDVGFVEQDKLISQRFGIDTEEAKQLREEKLTSNMLDMYYIYQKTKDFIFDDSIVDKSDLGIGEGIVSKEEKELFVLLNDSMIMYDDMITEISKVLQYYTNRAKTNKIDKVIMHGAACKNQSLLDFFNTVLDFDIEVIKFDEISNLVFLEDIDNKSSYINALGALIRYKED